MAYLKDIRENSIGPNGELWEADNRIEERHYWNGAYIDLCDLPAEEYTKTIFVTNGSVTPDTGSTPTIPVKTMTLEIVDGDVVLMFAGKAASEMFVSISYNGESQYTMKIDEGMSGASGIRFGLTNVMSVDAYGIGASETDAVEGKKMYQDENYKYQITYKEPVQMPVAYTISLMKGDVDNMSDAEIINIVKEVSAIPMVDETKSEVFTAVIEPIAVEGFMNMKPIEQVNILLEYAHDIIIITDKTIMDILAASTQVSVIEGWTCRENDVVIDGVSYHIWYKRANDTELSSVYDPAYPEITDCIVPEDSITYIIKYA